LSHRHDLIERERDHGHHRRCGKQARRAPRTHGERLEYDEPDAHDAERHDENTEEGDHPWHRPPPALVSHEAHEELDHVGDSAESRVGDGKLFGDGRREDALGPEPEERVGERTDMMELERGHLP
jgi:hypothetical protein